MQASLFMPVSDEGGALLEPEHGSRRRAVQLFNLILGLDKEPLPRNGASVAAGLGLVAQVSLITSAGLMLMSLAQVAGMHRVPSAQTIYGLGLAVIVIPASIRIAWPDASRSERLLIVLILGTALYCIKILHSPLYFGLYDESLHWITAQHIIEDHLLFSPNSLLPISRLYPGLEIVTTALTNLSGLSVFAGGLIVIGLARVAFLYALFLTAETLTSSSRVAAIASLVFMSNPNFGGFQALFAYESLALVLAMLAFLAAMKLIKEDSDTKLFLFIGTATAAASTVTHHLASYFCALVLVALAALTLMQGHSWRQAAYVGVLAAIAVIADAAWYEFTGGAGSGYLGPALEGGLKAFTDFLTSWGSGRMPFASADGSILQPPRWQKWLGVASFLLTCLGLATGFFRSLNLAGGRMRISRLRARVGWENSGLVLFTLMTLAFPLSVLLRLTPSSWEIGNRLGTYVSLGVCVIVAIAIAGLWQGASKSRLRATAIALLLTVMVVGGFVLGWGLNTINYPYRVIADSQSIEPLGIETAEWTKAWLGPRQRFASDRINQILLGTYGQQTLVTTQQDQFDISGILFADVLSEQELSVIRNAVVDYVLIDLRLTQALPALGVYFEASEDSALHEVPPEPAALLKFNKLKGVSRPFDSGAIVIYDVRLLHALH